MIVSVSGRIGHGKDLIGKIIQAYMEFPDASKLSVLRIVESGIDNSDTKIKKWADKLKDIVCILLNCTREQLEDKDFKEKELGEEWWYWKLEREGGYSPILLPYNTHAEALQMYEDLKLIKLRPRLLLQLLGTECGRNIIHPNIWVNSLFSEYKGMFDDNGTIEDKNTGRMMKYHNWIITDTRFPNELDAVKSRQGLTIKVVRPDVITNSVTGESFLVKVYKKEHESETALDTATFDYIIDNNDSIEELIEKVRQILTTEKIL